jgi:uncharacterized protein YggE
MKKMSLIALLSLAGISGTYAQTPDPAANKRYIEITGTSETEITPDELYVTITLLERMDGKSKVTIEKQESDLKKNLKDLGIDLSNLTLSTANADYSKVRRSAKDVLISKSYLLKVSGVDALTRVYERLDKIDAHDAYISKYTHSKILDFQKENRVKAIKAAREKADYLLAALDQKAGSPLQVMETENYVQDQPPVAYGRVSYMNVAMAKEADAAQEGSDISFKKIKIRSSFHVKYEILNK